MEVRHHLRDLDVVAFLVPLFRRQDKMDGIRLRDLAVDFIRMEMAGKDDDSVICGRFIFV
jgi:hypothetical protein